MHRIRRFGSAMRFCLELAARFAIARSMGEPAANYFAVLCERFRIKRKIATHSRQ